MLCFMTSTFILQSMVYHDQQKRGTKLWHKCKNNKMSGTQVKLFISLISSHVSTLCCALLGGNNEFYWKRRAFRSVVLLYVVSGRLLTLLYHNNALYILSSGFPLWLLNRDYCHLLVWSHFLMQEQNVRTHWPSAADTGIALMSLRETELTFSLKHLNTKTISQILSC